MIKWVDNNGLIVGMAGEKGVLEITQTCEGDYALINNIGNPVSSIKDKDGKPYTLERAKARGEEDFNNWFELVGGGNG